MNSAFKEIHQSFGPFSCFIFHDVDLLPEHYGNLYKCEENPVHTSLYIDKYGYDRDKMNADWGGVVLIQVWYCFNSVNQMKCVGGYVKAN